MSKFKYYIYCRSLIYVLCTFVFVEIIEHGNILPGVQTCHDHFLLFKS